ncbi:MAG: hypothetical protein AAFV98_10170 [Chloroflexota bacterium]
MAHKVSWLSGKNVLLVEFHHDVDVAELEALNGELKGYVRHGEAPVHIIMDVCEMQRMNMNLRSMGDAFGNIEDSDIGLIITVGDNGNARLFEQTLSSAFRVRSRMMRNLDSAVNVIREEDNRISTSQ